MKKLILLAAVVMIAGCAKQPEPAVTYRTDDTKPFVVAAIKEQEPKLTDKQKIDLLRKEAHARGLHWEARCAVVPNGSEDFIAFAYPRDYKDGAIYYEDGARDYWGEFGTSQADAAYKLYFSIQQPPPLHPNHAPNYEEHAQQHKKCPREIRGN